MMHSVFFFFFQAEDGIRDLTVTGVQTCALPISNPMSLKRGIDRAVEVVVEELKKISVPTAGRKEIDRKSTRLNSSHSQISYAVFCLKKKKSAWNKTSNVSVLSM